MKHEHVKYSNYKDEALQGFCFLDYIAIFIL